MALLQTNGMNFEKSRRDGVPGGGLLRGAAAEAGLDGQRCGVEAPVGDLPWALRRGLSGEFTDVGASTGESGGVRKISGALSGENRGLEDRGGVLRGSISRAD